MIPLNYNFKLINSILAIKNIKHFRGISVSRGCWIKNHYQVLGLSETCSNNEIKVAFFEKIKLLHPDKNAENPKCHNLVIALNEAYSVLSKNHTRTLYDRQLARERGRFYSDSIETDAPYDRVIFRDDSLWENRDRREDEKYKDRPYYGIKGINRLPNHYVATGVVIFMIVGAIIHFYIAKISASYALRKLDERSAIANEHYLRVRERALANENSKQMDLILRRSKETSNEKSLKK